MFERLQKNFILQKIFAFQQTPFYIAALAFFALLSNALGLDFLGFYVLGITAIFSLLFNPDTKAVIAPVCYLIFCISVQNAPTKANQTGFYTSAPVIAQLVILLVPIIVLLVVRFILAGSVKQTFKKATLGWGLVALCAGLLLNGLFYKEYTVLNLVLGIGFSFLFLGIYFFFLHTMKWDKRSIRYLAWLLFIMGILIALQLAVRYLSCAELRKTFDKDLVTLGWSLSNSIAYVLLLTMPFGFYLMKTARVAVPYYLLTTFIFLAVVLTFSRGGLLVATPLFIGGMVYTCFTAREKISPIVLSGILLLIAVVLLIVRREQVFKMLNFYIETGLNDRGRFRLWKEGLLAFLQAPVFGVGQMYLFGQRFTTFTWYHNTLLQFLATGGIIGLGTYIYHRVETVILFLKKPTIDRFFIGVAIGALLVNSLLDVGMSMPHIILFYSILLAFAEKDYQTVTSALEKKTVNNAKVTDGGETNTIHTVNGIAVLADRLDGSENQPSEMQAEKAEDEHCREDSGGDTEE